MHLSFTLIDGDYAIVRLAAAAAVPAWALGDAFGSVTRTAHELSIVCVGRNVPEDVAHSDGWRILRLEGPFDLGMTGVLLAVLMPLAAASVPIFAQSTFETDYVLVPSHLLERAISALTEAGHECAASGP